MQVVYCIYLKKVYFYTAYSSKFTTRVHKTRVVTKFVLVDLDRGAYQHVRMNKSGKCVLFPFQMVSLCGHLYWSLHMEILFVYSLCGPGNCFLNTEVSMVGMPGRFRTPAFLTCHRLWWPLLSVFCVPVLSHIYMETFWFLHFAVILHIFYALLCIIAEVAVSLLVYIDACKNFTLFFCVSCLHIFFFFAFVTTSMSTRTEDYEPYTRINVCRQFCIYFTHKTMWQCWFLWLLAMHTQCGVAQALLA